MASGGEAASQVAAVIEGAGEVELVVAGRWLRSRVEVVGELAPFAHRHDGLVGVEVGEDVEQLGGVVGEQVPVPCRDVEGDDLELPGRQAPVEHGVAQAGVGVQEAGVADGAQRRHRVTAGLVREPGVHGDGTVVVVQAGGVVVADRQLELGGQQVPDGEELAQGVAVQRHLKVPDQCRQPTEHARIVHTFDPVRQGLSGDFSTARRARGAARHGS